MKTVESVSTEVFRQLYVRKLEWEDAKEWLDKSDNLADVVTEIAKRCPEASVEEIEEGIKKVKEYLLK